MRPMVVCETYGFTPWASCEEAVAGGEVQNDLWSSMQSFFSLQGFQQDFLIYTGQFQGHANAHIAVLRGHVQQHGSGGGSLIVLTWWIVCMFTCVA